MTIYEINIEIEKAIEKAVDPETGEIIDDEAIAALDELQMAKSEKTESIILYYKDTLAGLTALKEEKQRLDERIKKKENKAKSLKNLADYALQGENFETARCEVKYRKSEVVDILDLTLVPEEFLKVKAEPMKADIKKAIKTGVSVPGAVLVSKQNIVIK